VSQEATKRPPVRRTEGQGRAGETRRDRSIAAAREWLRDAHRLSGSWEVVARDFRLGSKGSARRIALWEAELPAHVLERFLELGIWRSAARELGKRAKAIAIVRALERAGKSVATYDNRGKEVKP